MNRIQSRLADACLESDENLLLCAPTVSVVWQPCIPTFPVSEAVDMMLIVCLAYAVDRNVAYVGACKQIALWICTASM